MDYVGTKCVQVHCQHCGSSQMHPTFRHDAEYRCRDCSAVTDLSIPLTIQFRLWLQSLNKAKAVGVLSAAIVIFAFANLTFYQFVVFALAALIGKAGAIAVQTFERR